MFGYVSFTREHEGAEATDFYAAADFTEETAEANPDWTLDLSDEEIGPWRGAEGRRGEITLVWGVALVPNGAVATAELGPTTTDQCELVDDRFTLVSLDNYTGDYIEVRLSGHAVPSWPASRCTRTNSPVNVLPDGRRTAASACCSSSASWP